MKILLGLVFLVGSLAMATGTSVTASGGSPIPAAFSASDSNSKVLLCEGNVVQILNQTSTVLSVGFGSSSAVPVADYQYVPSGPNSGLEMRPMGGVSKGVYVYLRGLSSITSGTVQVSCNFEEQKK